MRASERCTGRRACSPKFLRDTHDGTTGTRVGFEFGFAGELRFAGETDRIYLNTPVQLSIVDPAWERRIELTSQRLR